MWVREGIAYHFAYDYPAMRSTRDMVNQQTKAFKFHVYLCNAGYQYLLNLPPE